MFDHCITISLFWSSLRGEKKGISFDTNWSQFGRFFFFLRKSIFFRDKCKFSYVVISHSFVSDWRLKWLRDEEEFHFSFFAVWTRMDWVDRQTTLDDKSLSTFSIANINSLRPYWTIQLRCKRRSSEGAATSDSVVGSRGHLWVSKGFSKNYRVDEHPLSGRV